MLDISGVSSQAHTKYELTRNITPQETAPGSAQEYFEQGVLYSLQQSWQRAIETYQKALSLRPDFYEAHFNLGSAYGNLGDHRNAITQFKKAIRLHSDDADAYYYVGLGHLLLGELDQAERALKEANRFYRNLTKSPLAHFAWIHLALGMEFLAQGWSQEVEGEREVLSIWLKAERALIKAVEFQESYPDAYWNLGFLYSKLGSKDAERREYYFAKAIAAYEKAKPLDAEMSAWAFNDLGTIYSKCGELQKAIESFQHAVEANPQNFIAFRNLGILHLTVGQWQQAAEAFEHSKQLEPNDPKTLSSLGATYLSLNRLEEAKENIEEALRLDPESTHAYTNFGIWHYTSDHFEEAKESFQRALEIDPSNEVAARHLQLLMEDQLKQRLFEQGLLSEIRQPITDSKQYENRHPIIVRGRPVSETLLEDRQ